MKSRVLLFGSNSHQWFTLGVQLVSLMLDLQRPSKQKTKPMTHIKKVLQILDSRKLAIICIADARACVYCKWETWQNLYVVIGFCAHPML